MIKADKIVKNYGSFRAVDNISFEVKPGEILGFLGPNGAGKSTTMKVIAGFLPPTSGTGFIGGHDIRENPIAAKLLLGYLPESGPLYQEMTVGEFLQFAGLLHGINKCDIAKAVDRVITICNLREVVGQPIDTLSKGYRQRVGLAQAVVHDPSCLILDEPTDGLDPNQKHEVRRLIAHMSEKKSIILSTHILEEVEAMCTRVIIIDRGKIVADEKSDQLRKMHPLYNAVTVKVGDDNLSAAKDAINGLSNVSSVNKEKDGLLVIPKNGKDIRKDIIDLIKERKWEVHSIESAPNRLEEVFHKITQKELS
jgi:ABC-2 type transport system ATP-binding protein